MSSSIDYPTIRSNVDTHPPTHHSDIIDVIRCREVPDSL